MLVLAGQSVEAVNDFLYHVHDRYAQIDTLNKVCYQILIFTGPVLVIK